MTLSTRNSTFGGIVTPICLAVFRLMMNSNLIGCSTGRSAGLVLLRPGLSLTHRECGNHRYDDDLKEPKNLFHRSTLTKD